MTVLYDEMVEQCSMVVRKIGRTRSGEIAAHRVLSSDRVTPAQTVACLARPTAEAVAGRRIVVAQDTTEVNFPGRLSRGLGPAGRTGKTPGFFLHASIAVDAEAECVLGLVGAEIWTRKAEATTARRERMLKDKESLRWLTAAEQAVERLHTAAEIVVVGDRESDFYALFARRPPAGQLLVRAAQNRGLDDGTKLFAAAEAWPDLGSQTIQVSPRGVGDAGREARLVLRAGTVTLRRPLHARREGDPDSLCVTLVEAIETAPPPGKTPLHWRLLSTLPAATAAEAAEIVRLYRLRWRIEQTFRMLKSDGLRIEECQTAEPHRLFNLAALAIAAAVRVIQLVDARDGSSRPASDVASPAQIAAAHALCPGLEGKTERQRNRHPPGSLAWITWIVARLGGWNCYYRPPGPKTVRDGWARFAAIAEGFALTQKVGQDV